MAVYSPRPEAIAAKKFEDNVPPAEKQRRLNKVEQLQEGIATEINAQLSGKTVEVLVEGRKKGKWQGRTRTGKLVFFSDNDNYLGRLVKIRIEKTSPWSLQGKFIMSRPQQKRQKEHRQLMEELKRGDRVITAGGIYGQIETVSDENVVIKVESGTTIRVARNSVSIKQADRQEIGKIG